MKRIYWDKEAQPIDVNLTHALYQMRCEDGDNPLLLDAITVEDIIEDADETVSLDALVTPFARLERRMAVMQNVMNRTGTDVKVLAMQVTPPFKNRGVTNVATVFELSDGQTISVFFHNPDTTPNRLAPTDEMISWKWLLNKKDVTIAVAPEKGMDLNIHEVARRLMRLADRNSAAFARANKRRAERLQAIQTAKDEVAQLEEELARIQKDIDAARIDLEDKQTKRDAEKTAYEARKAEKDRIEAERKAKEEAERQAAEERARQEEEQRKAAEEEAKQIEAQNAQPKAPADAAAESAERLVDASGSSQERKDIAGRVNAAAGDVSRVVRMFANAGDQEQVATVTKLESVLANKNVRAWMDPFFKRMIMGVPGGEELAYLSVDPMNPRVYMGDLAVMDSEVKGAVAIPLAYAKKIVQAVNPAGFDKDKNLPNADDVGPVITASTNPILKNGENIAEQKPEPPRDETQPNDLDVEVDKKIIQSIIDKTHPKISSPDLFAEIETLWKRYDGKNDEMMALLNQAVDSWSEVANELTKNVS